MNEEILKLAHSLNFLVIKQGVASLTEEHLEAFYRAAYNKAIEDAAIKVCSLMTEVSSYRDVAYVSDGISALEMKR